MEVCYDFCETGHPGVITSTLKRKISQLKRDRTRFKVGSTCNPNKRFTRYLKLTKLYKEMFVIYETKSIKNMAAIEEELIDFYRDHYENDNYLCGSAGPAGESEYHYVYVVVGKRKKL